MQFLGHGVQGKETGQKVSMEEVCKPKIEGGLGVFRLKIWNKALLAKHIWHI